MAEEKKQKSTFIQFILFIIMSLAAFVVQFLIVQFGPAGLKLCGVDDAQKMDFWIFKGYTLAAFISFLVANTLAKIISYILNRKKTFNAVNNLVFSMTVYVIMCVTLIIVETIIGEPLAKAYANLFANNPAVAEWAPTMSMITYSIADFLIVFLMEKFVIMNDNLFKKKGEEAEATEEAEEAEAAAEEEVTDAPEDKVEDEAAVATEEEVVEAPKAEEEPAKEEAPAEEVKEEKPAKKGKKEKEPEVEAAPIPEVEEKAEEVPAKEEAPAEEVKEEVPAEEVKAEEPAKEEAPVEEVKEEKPAKKAAAKKAPAKKAAEEKAEEEPAKEEAPKAAAKKPAAKAKNAGKVEFDLRVDGYHFEVSAMNGQLMYESQGFASLDTAKSGFDTFKAALEDADTPATVYQDKRGLWRFVINKRYVGEGYKTRAQAEAAIDSVKRDALLGTVAEFVEDPEEKKAYAAAKKNFNKGADVKWDEVLKAPAKTFGKFEITGHEGRGYFFTLYANNGQILYCSRYYASEDSCEDAITTFKKACYLNNFFIDKDKFGNWRFVLKGAGAGICYYGESYSTKDAAESSSASVKKFAMTAKIVVVEEE